METVAGALEAIVGAATVAVAVAVADENAVPIAVAAEIVKDAAPLLVGAAEVGVVTVTTATAAVAGYKLRLAFDAWMEDFYVSTQKASLSGPIQSWGIDIVSGVQLVDTTRTPTKRDGDQ